jgi:hypothetical protein
MKRLSTCQFTNANPGFRAAGLYGVPKVVVLAVTVYSTMG